MLYHSLAVNFLRPNSRASSCAVSAESCSCNEATSSSLVCCNSCTAREGGGGGGRGDLDKVYWFLWCKPLLLPLQLAWELLLPIEREREGNIGAGESITADGKFDKTNPNTNLGKLQFLGVLEPTTSALDTSRHLI